VGLESFQCRRTRSHGQGKLFQLVQADSKQSIFLPRDDTLETQFTRRGIARGFIPSTARGPRILAISCDWPGGSSKTESVTNLPCRRW